MKRTWLQKLDALDRRALRELKPHYYKVFRALVLHADVDGYCWPSVRTLLKETGIRDEETVYGATKEMEKLGLAWHAQLESALRGSPSVCLYRLAAQVEGLPEKARHAGLVLRRRNQSAPGPVAPEFPHSGVAGVPPSEPAGGTGPPTRPEAELHHTENPPKSSSMNLEIRKGIEILAGGDGVPQLTDKTAEMLIQRHGLIPCLATFYDLAPQLKNGRRHLQNPAGLLISKLKSNLGYTKDGAAWAKSILREGSGKEIPPEQVIPLVLERKDEAESRWNTVKENLAAVVDPHEFESWLIRTRGLGFVDGRILVVEAASNLIAKNLNRKFKALAEGASSFPIEFRSFEAN